MDQGPQCGERRGALEVQGSGRDIRSVPSLGTWLRSPALINRIQQRRIISDQGKPAGHHESHLHMWRAAPAVIIQGRSCVSTNAVYPRCFRFERMTMKPALDLDRRSKALDLGRARLNRAAFDFATELIVRSQLVFRRVGCLEQTPALRLSGKSVPRSILWR
jgi:hypothetical protein